MTPEDDVPGDEVPLDVLAQGAPDAPVPQPKWGRELPAALRASPEYRLTLWRDGEGLYHITETVLAGGKVARERELGEAEPYDVVERRLLDAAVELLTP